MQNVLLIYLEISGVCLSHVKKATGDCMWQICSTTTTIKSLGLSVRCDQSMHEAMMFKLNWGKHVYILQPWSPEALESCFLSNFTSLSTSDAFMAPLFHPETFVFDSLFISFFYICCVLEMSSTNPLSPVAILQTFFLCILTCASLDIVLQAWLKNRSGKCWEQVTLSFALQPLQWVLVPM